jgi:hypothetical protein
MVTLEYTPKLVGSSSLPDCFNTELADKTSQTGTEPLQ